MYAYLYMYTTIHIIYSTLCNGLWSCFMFMFLFHEACIFVSRWVLCIFLHHFFIKTYFMYFISYWCDWCYFTLREKFIFCAAENSCKINGYYKFRNFFNLAALSLKLAFKQSWLKFAFLNCKRVINVGVKIVKKINSLIIWL